MHDRLKLPEYYRRSCGGALVDDKVSNIYRRMDERIPASQHARSNEDGPEVVLKIRGGVEDSRWSCKASRPGLGVWVGR